MYTVLISLVMLLLSVKRGVPRVLAWVRSTVIRIRDNTTLFIIIYEDIHTEYVCMTCLINRHEKSPMVGIVRPYRSYMYGVEKRRTQCQQDGVDPYAGDMALDRLDSRLTRPFIRRQQSMRKNLICPKWKGAPVLEENF